MMVQMHEMYRRFSNNKLGLLKLHFIGCHYANIRMQYAAILKAVKLIFFS